MYYIVEIHNTESEEIGVLTHEEDGQQVISKFDSWSKAQVQTALLKEKLQPNLSAKTVYVKEKT